MIEIEQAIATQLIFHKVSIDDANAQINNSLIDIENEEELQVIKKIFLKPFLSSITPYEFKNDIDINLNTLYTLSKEILNGGNFVIGSINICKHLKAVSKHPNIKDGDLFVIKFDDIKVNGEFCEALGIYKIENKESFIENSVADGEIQLKFKRGISNRKLDKACLIVFTNEPFTVYSIDTVNAETEYWKNEFICATHKQDSLNHTSKFLTLTKSFITDKLPDEFEISKADQIDLLNRSVKYFKNHESFERDEFEEQVLQDKDVINAFKTYDKSYQDEHEFDVKHSFAISQQVVKKQAKIFKSVLKLDRNFHVYIHGDRGMIEQGVDPDGRKFYKLYFKEEN
jgi:hypothetical protein